jgi:adenylate cyclase
MIIILAMSTLTYLSLFFFKTETENRVRDNNISLSRTVARQSDKEILQLFDSANLLFQVGSASGGSAALVEDFFANSRSLIYVGVPGSGFDFANRDWFRSNRIFDEASVLNNILDARADSLENARSGETVVVNVSPLIPNLETPVIAMAAPFLLGTEQQALVILADVGSTLAESVRIQEGFTTTVIVNSDGEMLAHPDFSRVIGGENLRDSSIFQEMYAQGLPEGQVLFQEETINGPVEVMGSFALIPVGNLGVVTTVLVDDAFSVVRSIQLLNWSLLGAVLSLAILGIYFFSQQISNPLKELTLATRQIKAGNYNISIKPRTKDEVGQLTRNFTDMIPHLEARERLREKTEAFINKQVASMIDGNTLPDHAETKDVTVFFSDVRGFTSMSEAMGNPQLVLDNLSEYFRAMVPCVEETRGTVDKFIGDAVMAVWGSMQDLENNAESAVNGSLLMRAALQRFNSGRGGVSRPFFQIGCGLNSGPATVGIMGDPATKMEWAHMGDTVNLASRIEQLNNPMGTDILISQSTADKVKGIFHLVPMNKIKVKGKSEPQQIYAVLGRMDDDTRPRSLAEMRAMVGITGKFGQISDSEEHEVKYEILDS